MFVSAESEVVSTPTRQMPEHIIEEARLRTYQYHRRDGKIRRLQPEQFGHLENGMTSYRFMMQLDRGVMSDSDDEGESRLTVFADREGNEYSAWSRKRCHICRNTEYPVVTV
eukprot:2455855-Amphidinium_carterae.4